jgi:hypothetical protein
MDITKMLAELKVEQYRVEQAILVLERIASGRSKRRGRPPASMKTVKRRGRPPGSKNKPKNEQGGLSSDCLPIHAVLSEAPARLQWDFS